MADSNRGSIGFKGGQSLALRARRRRLAGAARRARADNDGWYALESEDGTVGSTSAQVVYVQAERSDSRVGFGIWRR